MCNRRVHKPNNSKWKSGRFLDILSSSSGIVYVFFFVFFSFKSLSGIFERFVRAGAKGKRKERGREKCYAALPPSSSTLQHNLTRTQTFNFEKTNCKYWFFFWLQNSVRDKCQRYWMFRECVASSRRKFSWQIRKSINSPKHRENRYGINERIRNQRRWRDNSGIPAGTSANVQLNSQKHFTRSILEQLQFLNPLAEVC